MRINRIILFTIIILTGGILAACSQAGVYLHPPATPTPEPTATATPIPERLLTICLGQEPSSLYFYNGNGHAMWSVLESIYDGPIDTRGYKPFPVILDKLPSLADGDASAQPMPVQTGDMVVDADGNVIPLAKDVTVYPSGCSDGSCVVTWDGITPLTMDRMIATYRLKYRGSRGRMANRSPQLIRSFHIILLPTLIHQWSNNPPISPMYMKRWMSAPYAGSANPGCR